MKMIIVIKFCVALLLTIVPDGIRTQTIAEVIDDLADRGKIIDGIFKPLANGTLGCGHRTITYRGRFIPLKIDVAMKFTPIARSYQTDNEYKMYTYLKAINEPSVTALGIPCIYYYGKWNDHTMLAMTILDCEFKRKVKAETIIELDILLLSREFVRMTKYIHSQGIVHGDVAYLNMMFQNGQLFLIDFGLSSDMGESDRITNVDRAKNDFKLFLGSLLHLFRFNLTESSWEWIEFSNDKEMRECGNYENELREVAKTGKKFSGLRRVLVEFCKHAGNKQLTSVRDADGTPFYDQLYSVINEEIINKGGEATSFDPSIPKIPDPFKRNTWPRPDVIYHFFEKEYAKQRKGLFATNKL